MIELNCTYEESKKIIELGYDFGKVCLEFSEIKTGKKFIKVNETQVVLMDNGFDLNDLSSLEWYDSIQNNVIAKYLIPIIPKAALEACLITCIVDCEQKRIFYLSYDRHKKPIYRRNYETPTKTIDTIYTEYASAYEAFIWLHENYPEELKAKFDEVMA
jgi:hypothetical protein